MNLNTFRRLALFTFCAVSCYIFFEWLFYVTKPSFLDVLSFTEQLMVFFYCSALVSTIAWLVLGLIFLVSQLPWVKRFPAWWAALGSLMPASILAGLTLICLDNFTYVLFRVGIVTTSGFSKAIYAVLFLLLAAWYSRKVLQLLRSPAQYLTGKLRGRLFIALAATVVIILMVLFVQGGETGGETETQAAVIEKRPHILLITGDGINAANMSVYGYERDTTPGLRKFVKSSLMAENAFANATTTTGSLASLYTGKYPTTTRVIYQPDILRGKDATQHLPGILRMIGYRTVQFTVPYYGAAYAFNLIKGRSHKMPNCSISHRQF